MAYVVTAPLVISKFPNGSDRYLYQGAELPEDTKPEDVERFLKEGFVADPDAKPAKSSK